MAYLNYVNGVQLGQWRSFQYPNVNLCTLVTLNILISIIWVTKNDNYQEQPVVSEEKDLGVTFDTK